MRRRARGILAVVAVLGATACNSLTGPELEKFIGTWSATKAEFVSVAWPDTKRDVVAQGGAATLVISTSSLELTFTNSPWTPDVCSGTWVASKHVMAVKWTEGWIIESEFDWSLNGDVLTLTGGPVLYQFGILEDIQDCDLNLILVRQ